MWATEWLVFAWCLGVLVSDLTLRRIPNLFSIIAGVAALAALAFTGESPLGASWQSVLIGVMLSIALTLPGYFARWLGAGDVKLFIAIALLGGWEVSLISFVLGAMLGALVALVLIMTRHSGHQVSERRWIPFGAALALGLMVTVWSKA